MAASPSSSNMLLMVKDEEKFEDIEDQKSYISYSSEDNVRTDSRECVICEVKFTDTEQARIHSMIHSEHHNCFVCNQFVKNRFQFVGHVRKHMCAKPFLCPEDGCDKTFANSRETKLHQRVHSEDRPFMCTECGKAFKQIGTLKDHEVVHTGEKRYKCKICEGGFATATSLRRHIRVMHEAIRTFLCHFCKTAFRSKQDLTEHLVIHRDVDPLRCQLCKEKLPNDIEFIAHKNKHVELKESGYCEYCANKTFYFELKEHIEKKHQAQKCELCSLVFYDDKSIENHRKSHVELPVKEELTCSICKKTFEFPRYLKAHLKRHERDYKKFKCDLCSKAFSSKRDLNDHLMVHANIKNYHCEICNKAFRTKQSVNKHMPIHSEKRPYKCKLCPKQFKKQSILRKHLITHSRTRPYCCELCGKSYKSKESLRVHKLSHQKDKFHCKLCSRSFKYITLFKRHGCLARFNVLHLRKFCYICAQPVKSILGFSRHVLCHSRCRTRFKCSTCRCEFKYKYRLKVHELRHKIDARFDVDENFERTHSKPVELEEVKSED